MKNDRNKKSVNCHIQNTSSGICIGMGIGALIGLLLFQNAALGLSAGLSAGLAIGAIIGAFKDKKALDDISAQTKVINIDNAVSEDTD